MPDSQVVLPFGISDTMSIRAQLELLRSQLVSEQSSFIPQWTDLAANLSPTRIRLTPSDTNKGNRKNQKILNISPLLARRTLQAGLMAGVTSPSRPWLRLTLEDQNLANFAPVKRWLEEVTNRMLSVFTRSNLYQVLPIVYSDMGVFGTACMHMQPHFTDVVRFFNIPIGSYRFGLDDLLELTVFQRDMRFTVRQMVDKFGRTNPDDPTFIDWSVFTQRVRSLWDTHQREQNIEIAHVVRPNKNYDPNKLESKFKKYESIYWERDMGTPHTSTIGDEGSKILLHEGHDYFPEMGPRWETAGMDTYATDCPGMTAIGEVRGLFHGERRGAQALDKKVNPPMVGPTHLKNKTNSIISGDVTYTDEREGMKGFRAAHEVNFSLTELDVKMQRMEERISRAFFEDLFQMITRLDRRQITAREIDERAQEKLLMLGPTLERINQDLLDKLVDNTYIEMDVRGMIPTPPDEIRGKQIKVEYISIMAQSQKLLSLGAIDRFTDYVTDLLAKTGKEEVMDKVNTDALIDAYAEGTGVTQNGVNSDDEVTIIRDERTAAIQAAAMQESLQGGAKAAKDLADAKLNQGSVLDQLLEEQNAGQLVPEEV